MRVDPPSTLDYDAEARDFFTGLEAPSPKRLNALVDENRYDVKLSFITWASQGWVARDRLQHTAGRGYGREMVIARMRTDAANGIYLASAKREYVDLPTRMRLPPPRLRELSITDRALSVQQANAYFADVARPNPKRLAALVSERRGNAQLWRLIHPGNERPTPADLASLRASRTRSRPKPAPAAPSEHHTYRRGHINPVGMSVERALELARDAQQRRDGLPRTGRPATTTPDPNLD